MRAILRLISDGRHFDVNIPIASDGQPILPALNDSIHIHGRIYVVTNTTWDYDAIDGIEVVVFANDSHPSKPRPRLSSVARVMADLD
jgi:hypothetical protein